MLVLVEKISRWESLKVLYCSVIRSYLVWLLFGDSIRMCLFIFEIFDLLQFIFLGGGGGWGGRGDIKAIDSRYTCTVCYSGGYNSIVSRDSYGSRSTKINCKVMWARKVVGVYSSRGTESI